MKNNVIQELWENKYLAAGIYFIPLESKALSVICFFGVTYVLSHVLFISILSTLGCITHTSFSELLVNN
jgi:hypothetical protein